MKRIKVSDILAAVIAASLLFAISTAVSAKNITHKVTSGDSLWTIAKKYKTTPSAIARANGISENKVLGLGTKLLVPSGSTAKSKTSGTTASGGTYTVKSGDSLSVIASRHKTTTAKLAKANGLSEKSVLRIGQKIKIPGNQVAAKSNASKAGSTTASGGTYTVKSGDSLSKIASKHKTTTAKLAQANGLTGKSVLQIGQKIKIPGQQTTAKRNTAIADGRKSAAKKIASSKAASPAKVVNEKDVPSGNLIQTALAYRGTRYVRGGTSRGGFDCSGFVRFVYAKYGIKLPHSSAAQAKLGKPVSKSELIPGDLVFFQTNGRSISHVGIYIGNGNFVHASSHGRGVTTDPLNSKYYAPRYRGARRVK